LQSAFLTALAKKPTAFFCTRSGLGAVVVSVKHNDASSGKRAIILGSIDPVTLGNPDLRHASRMRLQESRRNAVGRLVHCGLGRQR